MKLAKKLLTNWSLHNFVDLYCGITPGCALGVLLGLKTPIAGFFLMFVQNVIMYGVIVVFYGAKFKVTGLNT